MSNELNPFEESVSNKEYHSLKHIVNTTQIQGQKVPKRKKKFYDPSGKSFKENSWSSNLLPGSVLKDSSSYFLNKQLRNKEEVSLKKGPKEAVVQKYDLNVKDFKENIP